MRVMRWMLVALVLSLAGCAEPANDVPVETLVSDAVAKNESTYEFTLHARSIEASSQEVTFRLFVDGKPQYFLPWSEDERTETYEPVRRFIVPATFLS